MGEGGESARVAIFHSLKFLCRERGGRFSCLPLLERRMLYRWATEAVLADKRGNLVQPKAVTSGTVHFTAHSR